MEEKTVVVKAALLKAVAEFSKVSKVGKVGVVFVDGDPVAAACFSGHYGLGCLLVDEESSLEATAKKLKLAADDGHGDVRFVDGTDLSKLLSEAIELETPALCTVTSNGLRVLFGKRGFEGTFEWVDPTLASPRWGAVEFVSLLRKVSKPSLKYPDGGYNMSLLSDLVKIMPKVGRSRLTPRFVPNGDDAPALVVCLELEELFGLVMPLIHHGEERTLRWVSHAVEGV